MGITQQPPVPTPTTKGDIVVGTATGPVKLPVSTTANQTLLVDTTTATGLKYGSTTLSATQYQFPQPPLYAISGWSYTDPNHTFNTATAHNFAVGDNVQIVGTTGSAVNNASSTYTISSVTSTSFTVNIGAGVTVGTWTSGGFAYVNQFGNITGATYIPASGAYIFFFTNAIYIYSFNTTTWFWGHLPNSQKKISGCDFDGTTYVMSDSNGQIWTSTTLADGSWTSRYSGTNTFNGVKWCGGTTNKWVAYGAGNASGVHPGTSTIILQTATATGTWTSQTINGTSPSTGAMSCGFDGANTIAVTAGSHSVISTNAGVTWNGYLNSVTYYPNSTGGQVELMSPGSYPTIRWNSTASKWMAINSQNTGDRGTSTTSAPSSAWQKNIMNNFIKSPFFTSSGSSGETFQDIQQQVAFDTTNQRIYSWESAGANFNIYTYNANPTSINAVMEYYPLISISTVPNLINNVYYSSASAVQTRNPKAVWGNNKWVVANSTVASSPNIFGNGIIMVLQ